MCGRWSADGREVARRGDARVLVSAPAPGSLDFNERGTWSAVEVGPVQGDDPRAAQELGVALGVTRLGPEDLSPQGRLRATALAAAGHAVDGAWLRGTRATLHLGSGAPRGGRPAPLTDDELLAARATLPLALPPPLDQDVALAVLLARS